jgi:cytochrome c oxidase assembly protein subunit 15
MFPSSEKRFLKINLISIVTLFALILAGGIVRSTGSGMGCPDWPKCFGQYVPPTDVSQLPSNYHEKYVDKRVAKNTRFAKTIESLGFTDVANRIRSDRSILQPEEFNANKTWIEYVNRLLGVVYGLLLIGCVVFSITYIRLRKKIFLWSLLNLVLVGVQGWLGSIVVSTNLMGWIVTVHMILAVTILAISIYTYYLARVWRDRNLLATRQAGAIKVIAIVIVLLSLVQIVLGTTVREQIDRIASEMNNLNRSDWVGAVGLNFILHRDLAILVVVLNIILFLMVRAKYSLTGSQFKYVSFVMILLLLQIITGIVLSYLALPPVAQAVHVLLATLLFGAQLYLMLLLGRNKLYTRKLA